MARWSKVWLWAGSATLALVAFWVWRQYDLGALLTLDNLKVSRDALVAGVQTQPLATAALFFGVYVAATAVSIPGAVILTLAAGAMFGLGLGLVLVSFASSLGALLAFLVARYLLRDALQARFGKALAPINDGVRQDGTVYLLTLRLVPVLPFWLINLLMGLTPMGVARFYVVSQLGMLAATAVYVNAGTQLAAIQSPGDILSPGLLASFALVGLFPLLAKAGVSWLERRKVYAKWTRPKSFDRNLLSRRTWLAAALAATATTTALPVCAQAFDHTHAAWTALLRKHVRLVRGGQATQVNYVGFAADRAALKAYLDTLSAVPAATFSSWSKTERQAFLINAYNAYTVELILTRYPDLKSIKDLGSLLSSPWKPKWIPLLGDRVSLDDIEHGMLRQRGVYDDPRVHFAVNCASIGCPALREEAFVAVRLEAQLDEQTLRFMSDRTRNRFNPQRQRLELSKIFDWYGEDFRLGHRGVASLPAFAARYADQLADAPVDRERIRGGGVDIAFADYDWALNDVRGGDAR
jgi:uncharacterized membrane protein YdjX (TVP38/TMEM64 family)